MSETSAAQAAASRANGALSHGPVTPEGKCRSSLNATRHGLAGRVVVLPSEDMAQFQEFSRQLVHSLDPRSPFEQDLAQTIADQQWRLNRIRSIEDGMLASFQSGISVTDPDHPEIATTLAASRAFLEHSKAFVNLTIYEQRIHRMMEKTLQQLRQLQAERKAQEQLQLEEAVKLENLAQLEGQPAGPLPAGFVYSKSQIETECAHQKRLRAAETAWRTGRGPRKTTIEQIL
jgi:hypothetical protein